MHPCTGKTITGLYRSADGTLYGGGDAQLWSLGKTGIRPIPRPPDIPVNAMVMALTQDRAGGLWASFSQKGVCEWRDNRWSTPQGLPDPLAAIPIALAPAPQGGMWVGFLKNQLALLTGGKARLFGVADGLTTGTVTQILPMNGKAWVGGGSGLNYFDGTRFIPVRGKGDELFTGITGLVFGRDGTLWINGSNGVSSIAPIELARAMDEPGYPVRAA